MAATKTRTRTYNNPNERRLCMDFALASRLKGLNWLQVSNKFNIPRKSLRRYFRLVTESERDVLSNYTQQEIDAHLATCQKCEVAAAPNGQVQPQAEAEPPVVQAIPTQAAELPSDPQPVATFSEADV